MNRPRHQRPIRDMDDEDLPPEAAKNAPSKFTIWHYALTAILAYIGFSMLQAMGVDVGGKTWLQ